MQSNKREQGVDEYGNNYIAGMVFVADSRGALAECVDRCNHANYAIQISEKAPQPDGVDEYDVTMVI